MRTPLLMVMLALAMAGAVRDAAPGDALQERYAALAAAYMRGDRDAVRAAVLPDTTFVDIEGGMQAVEGALQALDPGIVRYSAVAYAVRDVHVEGTRATVTALQTADGVSLPTSAPQSFHLTVTTADVWRQVGGIWRLAGSRVLDITTTVSGKTVQQTAAPPVSEADLLARREALRRTLRPLTTLDPGARNLDFDWLGGFLQGARLVGAGEGSHGTAEHFQLKHRLFRELVTRHGFTVFAIEASFSDAFEVDRYVRGLDGSAGPVPSADEATRHFTFWTWQTREMRDLLAWMRTYNATRGPRPELRVVGVDMQDPVGSTTLITRLAPPDSALARVALPLAFTTDGQWQAPDADLHARVMALVRAADLLPPATPYRADLQHLAQTVRQGVAMAAAGRSTLTFMGIRDAAMAGNTRWMLDTYLPGRKAMLWAHNFHVARRAVPGQAFAPMGQHLAGALGRAYRTIGFSFGGGTVRALDPAHLALGPVALPVPAPPPGALDVLADTGTPASFLDLGTVPLEPALQAWFSQPVGMTGVGALYVRGTSPRTAVPVPQTFDGMILVPRGTAAVPLGQ